MNNRPRKRFAQHWLRSEQALSEIIQAAQLKNTDRLLEIGPGTGILTRRLLPEVESVVAVEIDRDLCKKLVKSLGQLDNFLLLQGDILSLDLTTELAPFPKFTPFNKVVANIPYNITGPILEYLLGTISEPGHQKYELIVLLMQKEVAERLTAKPGTKAYSALSIRVQYLAACEWICEVPARAFYPPPKVDSAVVRLRPQRVARPANNPRQLDTLVKLGFANRRKMLHNNLKGIIELERLTELLEKLEINPQCRAEELSLEQWIELSNQLTINTNHDLSL
ncbi:16S rRNA (adenine(1518)-N(6)/adenine(1519)-N(6))-dimethyltransferase RsmA [Gloeothece verrucosa]|uniref:Ribosomal RNA small subunit methyltransferase A n=1 Tax=Gloeothece verrucosa (strain PCC 7822) TaxID=497965 RepID=E0UFY3_GLOV7|nr:16S rRNA (adenine(1518)-N(6)/adenine(1519)-N(6))-dimethyltransferase RsmA [Gloeothece verrucosa]ADN14366.1 dimethyladenosine transferase [Gloeothece verrucosa PCC 7822]